MKLIPLYLDTETYSRTPIQHGTYKYAENAEIIMWQYAIGDGDVKILEGATPELFELLNDPQYEIIIHNSMFDRTVIRYVTGLALPVSRIFDTMVCALAHSLPGSLDKLCEVLGVDKDKAKDKEGKALINLFCKPQKIGKTEEFRADKYSHPEKWQAFCKYGELDIIAMREVYKKLPKWNYQGKERELWELDQKINDRGICVDVDLATSALRAMESAKKDYAEETVALTDGEVTDTSRRDKLLEHILSRYGITLPDVTSARVAGLLDDRDLPEKLKELLHIRLQSNKTSSAKYKRVLQGMNTDNRLRGLLQFNGASRTGRWAGRLFQPQNICRGTVKGEILERLISELKYNAEGLL